MRVSHIFSAMLCTLAALLLGSCAEKRTDRVVHLVVSNENDYDVRNVVSGLSVQSVMDSLHATDASAILLTDAQGQPVQTQLFDNGEQRLLLFECSVLANGESTYTLSTTTAASDAVACPAADPLPIAAELRRLQGIHAEADSARASLATALYNWEINERQHRLDSLMLSLDVSLLGGRLYPYPASSPRNPWSYRHLDVLAEGPLMCAYQLHYDTLRVAGDTLVEHRTLMMQHGSHITIVRDQMENVARHDTLLQLDQLAVTLPRHSSDSLVVREDLGYLALERLDSTAIGLFVPDATQALHLAESRQVAFLLPFAADTTFTYYVATSAPDSAVLTLPKALQELQQMHDAPLRVRIVVH